VIRAAKTEWVKKAFYQLESRWIFPRKFKKIEIKEIPIKTDHSILLLQNHISWWDGFWGNYLAYQFIKRNFHVMVQEDQVKKHPYLRYRGAYSVKKGSREMFESLDYTTELLKNPDNLVQIFPQGRLQSMHVKEIQMEKGVKRLISQLPSKCQVIYNTVTIEYLESFKPAVTFHLLDCGTIEGIELEKLPSQISAFHQEALKKGIR